MAQAHIDYWIEVSPGTDGFVLTDNFGTLVLVGSLPATFGGWVVKFRQYLPLPAAIIRAFCLVVLRQTVSMIP